MKLQLGTLAGWLLWVAAGQSLPRCKLQPTDPDWPTAEEWAAVPNVVARGPQTNPPKPDYRVDATSVEDVQYAVNFVREHNIRLSIVHSGHDVMARNDAPTGLLLGMHRLKGLRVENKFTPTIDGLQNIFGGKKNSTILRFTEGIDAADLPEAVTIGAGMTTHEINTNIADLGIFTLGAEHGDVGVAGGWTQCGGHSPMTGAYGLGVDNVYEFQVVTADGQLRVANEVASPDLFWALRGGCGSTFGVVVQATIKAFPSPQFTVAKFSINGTTDDAVLAPAAELHAQFPGLTERGVQGYYRILNRQLLGIFHTVGSKATQEYASETWAPILDKFKSMPDLSSGVVTYEMFENYAKFYDATFEGTSLYEYRRRRRRQSSLSKERYLLVDGPTAPESHGKVSGNGRLLNKDALTAPGLAVALKAAMPDDPSGMIRGALVGGVGLFDATQEATSIHPSWRDAYVAVWSDEEDVDMLANLAPGMGAYINEASWKQKDWKKTFWGDNYQRLSEIKAKYDPNMVFWATPGINADWMRWSEGGKLCMAENPA